MDTQDKELLNKLALMGINPEYKGHALTGIEMDSDIDYCRLPNFITDVTLIKNSLPHVLKQLVLGRNVKFIHLCAAKLMKLTIDVEKNTKMLISSTSKLSDSINIDATLMGGTLSIVTECRVDNGVNLNLKGNGFVNIIPHARINKCTIYADMGCFFAIKRTFSPKELQVIFRKSTCEGDLICNAFMCKRYFTFKPDAATLQYEDCNDEAKVLTLIKEGLLPSRLFPASNDEIAFPFKFVDGKMFISAIKIHMKRADTDKCEKLTIRCDKLDLGGSWSDISYGCKEIDTLHIIGDVTRLNLECCYGQLRVKKLIITGNVLCISTPVRKNTYYNLTLDFLYISGDVGTIDDFAFVFNTLKKIYVGGNVGVIEQNAFIQNKPSSSTLLDEKEGTGTRYLGIKGNVDNLKSFGGVQLKSVDRGIAGSEWFIGIGGTVNASSALLRGASVKCIHINGVLKYKRQLLAGKIEGEFILDLGGNRLREKCIKLSDSYVDIQLNQVCALSSRALEFTHGTTTSQVVNGTLEFSHAATAGQIVINGVEKLFGKFVNLSSDTRWCGVALVDESHTETALELINREKKCLAIVIVAKTNEIKVDAKCEEFLKWVDETNFLLVRGISLNVAK